LLFSPLLLISYTFFQRTVISFNKSRICIYLLWKGPLVSHFHGIKCSPTGKILHFCYMEIRWINVIHRAPLNRKVLWAIIWYVLFLFVCFSFIVCFFTHKFAFRYIYIYTIRCKYIPLDVNIYHKM
jgi:hypothetical protein